MDDLELFAEGEWERMKAEAIDSFNDEVNKMGMIRGTSQPPPSETISDMSYRVQFGKKHNGETLSEIMGYDPGWLVWASESEALDLDYKIVEAARNRWTLPEENYDQRTDESEQNKRAANEYFSKYR